MVEWIIFATILSMIAGILSGKLETLTTSKYRCVQYFLIKFFTFPTYQCLKKVLGVLLFCTGLDLVWKHSPKPGFLHFY